MGKLSQKEVWDSIAKDWKKVREVPRKEVYEFLNGCSGELLDVGCGSGRHFLKKEGLQNYGVDFSEEMIAISERSTKANSMDVELKVMKNEEIPYPGNFFDNLICTAVLHCVESKRGRLKLLGELKRVLKPEGNAFIQVWSKNHPRVKNKGKEAFIPWTINGKKFERYYHIYDLSELKEELEKVGFDIARIDEDENISVIVKK